MSVPSVLISLLLLFFFFQPVIVVNAPPGSQWPQSHSISLHLALPTCIIKCTKIHLLFVESLKATTSLIICAAYLYRVVGKLEPVPSDFGWDAGYTLGKSQICCRAKTQTTIYTFGQFKVAKWPNPENPEKTQTGTGRTCRLHPRTHTYTTGPSWLPGLNSEPSPPWPYNNLGYRIILML